MASKIVTRTRKRSVLTQRPRLNVSAKANTSPEKVIHAVTLMSAPRLSHPYVLTRPHAKTLTPNTTALACRDMKETEKESTDAEVN